jgi:GNAT superfamily N-acetyltransferase
MIVNVTTYYLEMTDPNDLRPKRMTYEDLDIRQAKVPSPELNRFLYTAVGGDWYWIDRLPWTYQQWLDWLDRPEVQTWVAYVSGTPAGYFELEAQPERNVELAYFGLLPQFTGKGLGGQVLTAAIERAWHLSASRVWVHTCSLDHPSALANYRARGFRVFREETRAQDLPEQTPGPWPGAHRQGHFTADSPHQATNRSAYNERLFGGQAL